MARESYIERTACKKARELGWRNRKLATGGGDPDRMFFKRGHMVLIEFKQPGQKPTPLQEDTLNEWIDDDFPATWVSSWQEAIAFLKEHDPDAS